MSKRNSELSKRLAALERIMASESVTVILEDGSTKQLPGDDKSVLGLF